MTSKVTVNPVLQETAVKFVQNASAFIGRRLFPLFNTRQQSESYYVFDRENMLNVPTNIRRAPSAPYSRSVMKLSDDNYNCREYGHEEPIDDGERDKYASALDADKAATTRATNIIMVNEELRVKALATSNAVPTSAAATKWDAAGGDPIGDIDAIKEIIRKGCGLNANVMSINKDTFNVLKELPAILDKIKYTQRGIVTADLIAAVFGVDTLLVAESVINGAAEGQTITPNDIWGDDVIVAHVESAQDLKAPNFGRTFSWVAQSGPGGVIVESYRQDEIKSDVFRARNFVDEKLVGAECGYRLSDVLS
jgi:hypothetical protein